MDWKVEYFSSVAFPELSMPRVGLFGDEVAFVTIILLQVILINTLIHQAVLE